MVTAMIAVVGVAGDRHTNEKRPTGYTNQQGDIYKWTFAVPTAIRWREVGGILVALCPLRSRLSSLYLEFSLWHL